MPQAFLSHSKASHDLVVQSRRNLWRNLQKAKYSNINRWTNFKILWLEVWSLNLLTNMKILSELRGLASQKVIMKAFLSWRWELDGMIIFLETKGLVIRRKFLNCDRVITIWYHFRRAFPPLHHGMLLPFDILWNCA